MAGSVPVFLFMTLTGSLTGGAGFIHRYSGLLPVLLLFPIAKKVRELADIAGTSEKTVQLNTQDEMPIAADGKKIFLGRVIRAKITGRPDQVSSSLNR